MDIIEFAATVEGFGSLSHPDRIKLLAWYQHTHQGRARFDTRVLAECYDHLHYDKPNFARDLGRLASRRPPEVLRDAAGYRLEGRVRSALDRKLGMLPASIAVGKLLDELPMRVGGIDQRAFLGEAINCYKVKAFRATIVMAWNLAFDHLLQWLMAEPPRLAEFNARIAVRYPKKVVQIVRAADFEQLKESEVIEIASSAGLISGSTAKVLVKELPRRNSAAHPSTAAFTQYQAEDAITDLVNNVVLALS